MSNILIAGGFVDAGDRRLQFVGQITEGGNGAGGFVQALQREVLRFAVARRDEGVADGQRVEAFGPGRRSA